MSVRKTEMRIPTGLAASDLGDAVVATDGRCALVSYLSSPLAPNQQNTYVLFVTDSSLASSVNSYDWSFEEDGAFPKEVKTSVGEASYTASTEGNMTISVSALDSSGKELASLTLIQDVGPLNPALEDLIDTANDDPGPGANNPVVLREIVNAYYSYYQNVTLKVPEGGDAFKRYVCSFLFDATLKKTPDERDALLDELSDALENNPDAVPIVALQGAGVCGTPAAPRSWSAITSPHSCFLYLRLLIFQRRSPRCRPLPMRLLWNLSAFSPSTSIPAPTATTRGF